MTSLLTYLLGGTGLTILIVWPGGGPAAFFRDRVLRSLLGRRASEALDCYICCGFWCGLLLAPLHWWMYGEPFVWFGCLMIPMIFWLLFHRSDSDSPGSQ